MHNILRTLLLLGAVAALAGLVGRLLGGTPGAWLGAAVGLWLGVMACLWGARVLLHLFGAREIDSGTHPHLLAMVDGLAHRAAVAPPRVFVLDAAAANAFAVGCGRARSAVVLTRGILCLLDERELRAVLAHEFGHIVRGDVLPGTLAAALGSLLAVASQGGSAPSAEPAGCAGAGMGWQAPLWVLLAPLAALFAQLGSSARRELAADRIAAALCGDASALASALQRLQAHADDAQGFALAARYPAGVQMMVCDPLDQAACHRLFRGHPPIARRVQALRALADAG